MRKTLCSLAAALAFGSFASAQLPGFDPDPVPAPKTAPAPKPAPAKAPSKQLNIEELGVMLENLGFEITPVKNDKGDVVAWDAKIEIDGTTIYPRFSLSPNGKFLWITDAIAQIKDAKEAPKEVFVALLAANAQIGPCQLQYDHKSGLIIVALGVTNSNFTPADMRYMLQVFAYNVKHSVGVWKEAMKAAAVAKAKEPGNEPLIP